MMHRLKKQKYGYRSALYATVLCLLPFLPCLAGGEPTPETVLQSSGISEPAWLSLRYEKESLAGGASTVLELSSASRQEMQLPPFEVLRNTAILNSSNRILMLSIRARSDIKDYSAQARIWFDPTSGAVLQRDKLRPGPEGSWKIYRFTPDGFSRIRLKPKNEGEAAQAPEHWSDIKTSEDLYDASGTACHVISEPTLLLYLASSPDFIRAEQSLQRCVFFDGELYRVLLQPHAQQGTTANYTLKSGDKQRTIGGERKLIKVSLKVEPVTRGADLDKFELLELRGDIAFYLDAETGLPVILSGKRFGFTREIELSEAVLRD